jgi:hypothetical protein
MAVTEKGSISMPAEDAGACDVGVASRDSVMCVNCRSCVQAMGSARREAAGFRRSFLCMSRVCVHDKGVGCGHSGEARKWLM